MSPFAGRHVLVVGLGSSGSAAARVLLGRGARVRVSEARVEAAESAEVTAMGAEVLLGGHAPEHLEGVDLVVTSPGVPEDAPVLRWAGERGIPVWSELELGARICEVPYVAVTGTNGKTTTTELIASMLLAAGTDAVACGNIGHPFSLAAGEDRAALVVEASSFQLRFQETFHPCVSVLLNIAPDHLDWHGSFESYREAKARIFEQQTGTDVHVGNADDENAASVSRNATCTRRWFTLGDPADGEVGYTDGELVARFGQPRALGAVASRDAGYRADAAAAAAAALAFGVEPEAVEAGLRSAPRLPHRGATIATVGGVSFVDDSKATNPHAALASLQGREDVVLIAGGLAKGVDLSPLAAATPVLRAVVAIGTAAPEVAAVFDGLVPVHRAGSMEEAVDLAARLADERATVLLAPACASQDMFRDYADRGDRFAAAVHGLAERTVRG